MLSYLHKPNPETKPVETLEVQKINDEPMYIQYNFM